jgi:nucleoside-diphosphate-sugar epimerase
MEVWRASAEGLNVVIINPGMIIGSGNWETAAEIFFLPLKKTALHFQEDLAM